MKSIILIASIVAALSCISCKKENDDGIPTVLKGHVQDSIRGINIRGYQIVLIKEIGPAPGWDGGTLFERVAEAYTDQNGDYAMTFNYKLEPGQNYYLEERWSRPKSEINIIFYYVVNYASPTPTVHEKIIPYHTTLDSTMTLNYTIDCSTF
jgi:hypothetical protein